MKRLLFLLLALSVTLAGCAKTDGGEDADTTTTPTLPAMSNEDAESLVEQAAANLPERYGFDLTATKNGNLLMSAEGTFDNASRESYLTLTGSPAAFAGSRALADGFSIYASEQGAVYRIGDLTIVQTAAVEAIEGFVPSALFTPAMLLDEITPNLTVTSVQPTTWEGEPALDVSFEVTQEGQTATGKFTLLQDPARIVHVEATMPDTDEAGPLGGALLAVSLTYGDDVAAIPEEALRSLGFAYATEGAPGRNQTWTFQREGDIPLADVRVLVMDANDDAADATKKRVVFSLTADEAAAAQEGVAVAFDDATSDGLLSSGDTLSVTVESDATFEPQVMLQDVQTGAIITADFVHVFQLLFSGFGG